MSHVGPVPEPVQQGFGVPAPVQLVDDGSGWAIPSRSSKPTLKDRKFRRSPRQWNGSRVFNPRSVWVVIGPFIGSKPLVEGPSGAKCTHGACEYGTKVPCGSPRSQARLSKLPNTWQVAHAMSPWPESCPS